MGKDFEIEDVLELTFPPNVSRLPVPITIFDDELPEMTESITLVLMRADSNRSELFELAPIASTRVNILDNDGEGVERVQGRLWWLRCARCDVCWCGAC